MEIQFELFIQNQYVETIFDNGAHDIEEQIIGKVKQWIAEEELEEDPPYCFYEVLNTIEIKKVGIRK